MQSSAATASFDPSSFDPSTSFAGALESLTTPGKKFPPKRETGDLFAEDFADDVATLSYESALRTHGRYKAPSRPPMPEDVAPIEPATDEIFASPDLFAASAQALAARLAPRPAPQDTTQYTVPAPLARNLKRASITIRLSEQECAQLRQRASESGLSVSAYLRSCTLEVEELRAQVKATLAQMRSTAPPPQETHTAESPAGKQWWSRLLGRRRRCEGGSEARNSRLRF